MFFHLMRILKNLLLDYIFFFYPLYLQNLKMIKKSIVISSIKCLIFKFLKFKVCIKDEFIDQIINNFQLLKTLTCVLKTYRTCIPMVEISKYKFREKFLIFSTQKINFLSFTKDLNSLFY